MELDFAFLASGADTCEGKFFVLGGGIDTFRVSKLPALMPPFAVVVKFSISEDERDQKHHFKVELKKPNGESEKMIDDGKLPFEKHTPGRRSATTFVLQLGMPFEHEGAYAIEIFGDGEHAIGVPFWVEIDHDLNP